MQSSTTMSPQLIIIKKKLSGRKKLIKTESIKENILQSLTLISRKDICLLWPDISVDTVRKALTELQKVGFIKKRYYSKMPYF